MVEDVGHGCGFGNDAAVVRAMVFMSVDSETENEKQREKNQRIISRSYLLHSCCIRLLEV
jgi:hypothetical protein